MAKINLKYGSVFSEALLKIIEKQKEFWKIINL